MTNKDYYKILGVDEKARSSEIKKSYRRLAKQYHPDSHPGDKAAEARFKEIAEAYEVLSDDKKRQQYDQFRKFGGAFPGGSFEDIGGFRFERRSPGGGISDFDSDLGFGDLFSRFFDRNGGRTRSRSMRGQDIHADIQITFEVAVYGGKQTLSFNVGGKSKILSINIKPGIEDGEKIRLRGQGARGLGSEAGDLFLTAHILPRPGFRREGQTIISTVEINLVQALLGTKIQAQTLQGTKVEIKVPPGSQNGQRLRLKGLGINSAGKPPGDYFIELSIVLPEKLNDAQKRIIEEFARESGIKY
ncbi:MAG: DnaJ C-terminal domain-containing protein [bacterium]